MRNGTSQAVLVGELLSGDGPHITIADDFVTETCSLCGAVATEDPSFTAQGYLCTACNDLFTR